MLTLAIPHPTWFVFINAFVYLFICLFVYLFSIWNHLTGCAVDIRCLGIEQALRYAVILLDIADEGKGWHRQNKTSFLLVFYSLFRNFSLCEKMVSLEKTK